jgi:hypothetical protein
MAWNIDWYICRADRDDVAANKASAKPLKVGDEFWRVPRSIGPISVEHNHWAGYHLDISVEDALKIAAVPEMVELLQWLDKKGGLGLDVHARIGAVLAMLEAK